MNDVETEFYSDMVDAYSDHIPEKRIHELYDLTDSEFSKLVFPGKGVSEPVSLLDVFTMKELNFILDYSEFLGEQNRDWIANYVLDESFIEER